MPTNVRRKEPHPFDNGAGALGLNRASFILMYLVLPDRVWVTTMGSGWGYPGGGRSAGLPLRGPPSRPQVDSTVLGFMVSSLPLQEGAAWKIPNFTRCCWASDHLGA